MLPEEALNDIREALKKYPDSRSALLPSLYIAQHHIGHLPLDALKRVAKELDLPEAQVLGVASFHVMFRNYSSGRHLVQLCTNVACMSSATEEMLRSLKEKYGMEPGATSPDKRFTLVEAECIGECDKAPAMIVDSDVHTHLTPQSLLDILDRYE